MMTMMNTTLFADQGTETTASSEPAQDTDADDEKPTPILVVGGGLVGLVVSLALHRQCRLPGSCVEIYEQSAPFGEAGEEVGAAITLLANGLRVLRDILEPSAFRQLRRSGAEFEQRSWMRHDGTVVAVADDSKLHCLPPASDTDDDENSSDLHCLGIRRSKLQALLYQAVQDAGIPVFFRKSTQDVRYLPNGNLVEVFFADGTSRFTQLVLACDGNDSQVRKVFTGSQHDLEYTEITCLMGICEYPSDVQQERQRMEIPSSVTSELHGMYFPTSANSNECCFQLYSTVSTDVSDKNTWGNLSQVVAQQECHHWAQRLRADGWHDRFIRPLQHVTHAVRVGFCTLDPPLEQWAFACPDPLLQQQTPRVVLVGDAAHPPVPFLGQGAQIGIEDAGTLAMLLREFCCSDRSSSNVDENNSTTKKLQPQFQLQGPGLEQAIQAYQVLRIPRAATILAASLEMGYHQTSRCQSPGQQNIEEEFLQQELQSSCHGNLPGMILGASHDYRLEVEVYLKQLHQPQEVEVLEEPHQRGSKTTRRGKRRNSSTQQSTERRSFASIISGGSFRWKRKASSVGRNLGRIFSRNDEPAIDTSF